KWMNGHYIRASEPGRIIGMCLPYLVKAGLIPEPPRKGAEESDKDFDARKEWYRVEVLEYARKVIPLEQERMKTLSEVTELVGFFFQEMNYPDGYEEKAVKKWFSVEHLRPLLEKEIAGYGALEAWTAEGLEKVTRDITEEMGLKFAEVIHPTR